MNILVIGDEESKYLWDYFDKTKLNGVDLILSSGDLSPHYLSFLATFTHAPVLYIHGNHDCCYTETPPNGCICIEDSIYVHNGIRILGLGGCMRYNPGAYQFSNRQMQKRINKLRFQLWKHKGFDILLTHAPAFHINDANDLPHTGFEPFVRLLEKYSPKYFIHGHVHATYGGNYKRRSKYNLTQIINSYERYSFNYETGEEYIPEFVMPTVNPTQSFSPFERNII